MNYTAASLVANYLERDLIDKEMTLIAGIISSISNQVSVYLGREYLDYGKNVPPTATERYYDGNGTYQLFIDDFSDLVRVDMLDYMGGIYVTIDQPTDFILEPYNTVIKSAITLRYYGFNAGNHNVKVTAKFHSGVLPPEVQAAVTGLVGNFIVANMGQTGFVEESIEGYSYKISNSREHDTIVESFMDSIAHLRKITF